MSHPKYKIFHDEDYLKWIRTLPCLVCGASPSEAHHDYHAGGKKLRNDYLGLPLCAVHHTYGGDSYHRLGRTSFEGRHSLDLNWEVINLLSQYINNEWNSSKSVLMN